MESLVNAYASLIELIITSITTGSFIRFGLIVYLLTKEDYWKLGMILAIAELLIGYRWFPYAILAVILTFC